jgi:AraC family transcriptional regulator
MSMKPCTKEEHQRKINKVIDYISYHLDENPDLTKLSDISAISPFHLHRIMKAYLGEPLGSYIIRHRIETGAQLLRYSPQQIEEIAYKIGYDSPTSFTKAFKKHFGISPSEFRNNNNFLSMKPLTENKELPQGFLLKPKIVDRKSIKVIYIRLIGNYQTNDYGQAWEKLFKFVKEKHLFSFNQEYIGISYDDPNVTETNKCQYYCCVTVNKDIKPEGEVGTKEIEGGKYAVFKFKGGYHYFGAVYNAIYNNWLENSGFELKDIPSFERYVKTSSSNPEKNITEIYIPID